MARIITLAPARLSVPAILQVEKVGVVVLDRLPAYYADFGGWDWHLSHPLIGIHTAPVYHLPTRNMGRIAPPWAVCSSGNGHRCRKTLPVVFSSAASREKQHP